MNRPDPEDLSPIFTPGFAMLQTLVGNSIFILTLILLVQITQVESVTYFAIATIVGYGAALGLAFPFIGDPPGPRLGFRPAPTRTFIAAALFIPSALIGSELENVFADFVPRPTPAEGGDVALASGSAFVLARFLTFGIVLPLVYQTFFYGLIQPRLERWWGSGGAVVGTALLAAFAMSSIALLISTDRAGFLREMLVAIGPALLYGMLRRASASIYPGLVAACGIGALLTIATIDGYEIQGFTTPGGHTPIRLLMLPAVMVGIGLGLCRRPMPPPPEAAVPRNGA